MGVFAKLFGGDGIKSVGDVFSKVVGCFKLSPEKKAEFEALKEEHAAEIDKLNLEIEGKLQDAISTEIQSAAAIIQAEAKSQSWLPRNVRPLLMLLWGVAISFNIFVPIIARYWLPGIEPLKLDPWVYKLTAIGYTGYVAFRSTEKVVDTWKGGK